MASYIGFLPGLPHLLKTLNVLTTIDPLYTDYTNTPFPSINLQSRGFLNLLVEMC